MGHECPAKGAYPAAYEEGLRFERVDIDALGHDRPVVVANAHEYETVVGRDKPSKDEKGRPHGREDQDNLHPYIRHWCEPCYPFGAPRIPVASITRMSMRGRIRVTMAK